MKYFLSLLFLCPVLVGAEPWTRVSIKSAFVSHGTYEANRDFFSAPEFGWNIRSGGALVMRADLYGDLFAPRDKPVELVFVEQDIVIDDVIVAFPIAGNEGRKDLVSGEDRFTIEVGPFDPEAKSGPDASSPIDLKGTMKDHVSFVDQDRTDSYRVSQKLTLVIPDFPSVQVSADACKNLGDTSGRLILVECERGGVVRVQSGAGAFLTAYSIEGAPALDALLPGLDAKSKNESYLRTAAYDLFEKIGRQSSEAACSRSKTLPLCGYYLYRNGDRAARAALRKLSPDQSYTDALDQAENESPEQ